MQSTTSLSGGVQCERQHSFKGQRQMPCPARKRGGKAKSKGMSDELVPVLVVRDRSGQHADFQLERLDGVHVGRALKPLIDPDAMLCTDSAAIYHGSARAGGITHHCLNLRQKTRTDGAFYIQSVNAYHSRLKGWLHPFIWPITWAGGACLNAMEAGASPFSVGNLFSCP